MIKSVCNHVIDTRNTDQQVVTKELGELQYMVLIGFKNLRNRSAYIARSLSVYLISIFYSKCSVKHCKMRVFIADEQVLEEILLDGSSYEFLPIS